MFDNLKFWKRHETYDNLDHLHNDDFGAFDTHGQENSQNQQGFDQSQQQQPFQDPFAQQNNNNNNNQFQQQNSFESPNFQHMQPTQSEEKEIFTKRDVELILSKLDTIKVSLDNLSHRVERLENHKEPKQTNW